MSMVAPTQRLASAYAVHLGRYGDVQRLARQRGVCRQWLYREAAAVLDALDGARQRQQLHGLRQQVRQLQDQLAALQRQLSQAVVLDRDKQAEFARVGQARGVTLPDLHCLLDVLRPGRAKSIATLGRWAKSAQLLAVFDDCARPRATQALLDEIYLRRPALMVVEPESLCWLSGRLPEALTGAAWAQELAQLPNLEQVTRDGGSCLGKGVAQLNQQRQQQGRAPVADQLDHFHVLREGGRGIGRLERAAQRAQAGLAKAQAEWDQRQRRGQVLTGARNRLRARQAAARRALELWVEQDAVWQEVKGAVQLFTPEGELNTRARAEAVLAEALPRLREREFAKVKRLLVRPGVLTYLDEVQRKLKALSPPGEVAPVEAAAAAAEPPAAGAAPLPAAVVRAAVRQEGLKRRPEVRRGEGGRAAALRGVLLACAVVLSKAGEGGARAVAAVRAVLRGSWRASSLVECVNGVLRMQQTRHKKVSQGLLDLKRLYWNSHVFRTGRRRKQSPYQRLGVPWPEGLRWWDLLKWSPERLRHELSTPKEAR